MIYHSHFVGLSVVLKCHWGQVCLDSLRFGSVIFCSLHSPHKTEFIKAKYQMLAYVHRMPCREDDSVTTKDLSKVRDCSQTTPWIAGFIAIELINLPIYQLFFIIC